MFWTLGLFALAVVATGLLMALCAVADNDKVPAPTPVAVDPEPLPDVQPRTLGWPSMDEYAGERECEDYTGEDPHIVKLWLMKEAAEDERYLRYNLRTGANARIVPLYVSTDYRGHMGA